jgi:hypothetical protein
LSKPSLPNLLSVTTRIGACGTTPAKVWIRRTTWVNVVSKVSARPRTRTQRNARVSLRR